MPDELWLHRCGFLPYANSERGFTEIYVGYFHNGKLCDNIDPVRMVKFCSELSDEVAQYDLYFIVLQQLCVGLMGGLDVSDLRRMVEKLATLPTAYPTYKLVSCLPGQGTLLIWQAPDGRYLKVVTGDEGFTESMRTQHELLDSLSSDNYNLPDGGLDI